MKKIIILGFCILLVVGCGFVQYNIHGHFVSLDETVDFRHIHYQTSTSFDYNSDKNYRSYCLYDKRPNVLYSVKVSRVMGSINKDVEAMKKEKNAKMKKQKIHGISWILLTYKEEKEYHLYYASYDKKEYYQVEFYHADYGKDFEKQFMKTITIDRGES